MDETADNSTPWWGQVIDKVIGGAVSIKQAEINAQAGLNNYGSWSLDANGRLVRNGYPNNVTALQTTGGGINSTALLIGLAAVALLVVVANK